MPHPILLPCPPSHESVDSPEFRLETVFLETDSGSSMPKAVASAEKTRLYRQRLRANGGEEVLVNLPRATLALIDELKQRQGLRSRSHALLQLIEQGRAAAQ